MNLRLQQVAAHACVVTRTHLQHHICILSITVITIVINVSIEFTAPTGPELAVAGEDIVLSDDEGAADDKPYYMTVNGKQVSDVFFLPRVTVTLRSA